MHPRKSYLPNHFSAERRIVFITALFWLIAKIISWKVWTANRIFPLVPVFEFLKVLPSLYHVILFCVSIFCLVILLITPSSKFAGLLILSELLSLIADQNRWQPWEYQYLFIIFIFWVYKKRSEYFYSAVIFILICIYFYSGLSKLNPGFLYSVWGDMILHRFLGMNIISTNSPILYNAGYTFGVIEIASAIGLFFKPFKKTAALLLIIVHCFNLLVLGPWGINYNVVVWPWNIAMICYLYILFIDSSIIIFNIKLITTGWNKLILICWGFLPILNYFGWWDNYLSFALYTGRVKEMIICLKNPNDFSLKSLEQFYNTDYKNICDNDKMIRVTRWAINELKVPVYPEKRVYLKIKQYFIKEHPTLKASFYLYTYYMDEKEELK